MVQNHVIGFDYGTRFIGVAVCDTMTCICSSLCCLRSNKNGVCWHKICEIYEEWKPIRFIIGYPYQIDGKKNDSLCDKITLFVDELKNRFSLNVELVDERYTTRYAIDCLRDSSFAKCKYIKENVDELSAVMILESWLSIKEK